MTDPRDPATERDFDAEMVELALAAGAENPMEYRRGMFDAINVVRWGLLADPSDARAAAMCSLAAQFAVAVEVSITGGGDAPVGGVVRPVPAGLGRDAFARPHWADALWAATAGGDAPSAVRLAHIDHDALPHDDHPTASELTADVLAAVWRGADATGRHLVDALEATDPAGQGPHRTDELLDLAVPILDVLRHVDLRQAPELTAALGRAVTADAEFWTRNPPNLERDRVSLMLIGATRLAATVGADVPTDDGLYRAVFGMPMPITLGCPVCANPAHPDQSACAWCGTDLTADALLELAVVDLLGAHLRCARCRRVNRAQALRCWGCGTSLRSI